MKHNLSLVGLITIMCVSGSFAQSDPDTIFPWETQVNDFIRSNSDSAWHYLNLVDTTGTDTLKKYIFITLNARLLTMEGRPSQAMALLLETAAYFETAQHLKRLAKNYDDIAFIYQKLRQHNDHRLYAEEAVSTKQTLGDNAALARSYTLLGNYYFYNDSLGVYRNQISNAAINYRLGLESAGLDDAVNYADNLIGLANVYFKYYAFQPTTESLSDSTLYFFQASEAIYESTNNLRGMIYAQQGLFQFYAYKYAVTKTTAYLDSMTQYLGKTALLLQKIKDTELALTQTKHASYLEETKGNYKQALQLKHKHYFDALTYNTNTNIERVQLLEETFKRDTTVRSLETKNLGLELQTVRAESQRNLFIAFALVLLSILIFIYVWFKNRLQKRKLENVQAVLESQENERKRIARDLHDGVGVLLTAVQRQLEGLEENGVDQRDQLLNTTKMMDEASQEVRKVAHNMMPGTLTKLGLEEALEDLFDRVRVGSSLQIDSRVDIERGHFSENSEVMIYRIVQELTNNTLKYANAGHVRFELRTAKQYIRMVYQDDGQGFDTSEVHEGIGLKSIYSRTDILKGKISLEARPNEGVLFTFSFPLKQLDQ